MKKTRVVTQARLGTQRSIKRAFSALGLHVRYAFQYPMAAEAKVAGRFVGNPAEVATIFDVGANVGQTSLLFAHDYERAEVYAFEPFAGIYEELKRATSEEPRIRPFRIALGAAPGIVRTHFSGTSRSQMNRVVPVEDGEAVTTGGHVEEVRVETLDEFCAHHKVERIDILKTDTEGFDVNVLQGGARMLQEGRVSVAIVECGFLEDRAHSPFEEVSRELRQHGFEVGGFYEATYLPNGSCDFCNVLFVARR